MKMRLWRSVRMTPRMFPAAFEPGDVFRYSSSVARSKIFADEPGASKVRRQMPSVSTCREMHPRRFVPVVEEVWFVPALGRGTAGAAGREFPVPRLSREMVLVMAVHILSSQIAPPWPPPTHR